jgi:hypothetical protein
VLDASLIANAQAAQHQVGWAEKLGHAKMCVLSRAT